MNGMPSHGGLAVIVGLHLIGGMAVIAALGCGQDLRHHGRALEIAALRHSSVKVLGREPGDFPEHREEVCGMLVSCSSCNPGHFCSCSGAGDTPAEWEETG